MLRKVPVAAMQSSFNLSNRESSAKRAAIHDLPSLHRTANVSPEAFSRLVADHFPAWADIMPHVMQGR